jgi:hypothetical protein
MPWTGEPDGWFGAEGSTMYFTHLTPNQIHGNIAKAPLDCYPVKLSFRYQDLSGDYSRTKMALYEGSITDSDLIATTEEKWLDPLFNGWADYYTTNFPLLKKDVYYTIVLWTTSPKWNDFPHPTTAFNARGLLPDEYGLWPDPVPAWSGIRNIHDLKCYYTLEKPPD